MSPMKWSKVPCSEYRRYELCCIWLSQHSRYIHQELSSEFNKIVKKFAYRLITNEKKYFKHLKYSATNRKRVTLSDVRAVHVKSNHITKIRKMAVSNRSLVAHSSSVCIYPSCSAENVHKFLIMKNCLCKTVIPFFCS